MDQQDIEDTIKAANEYLVLLKNLQTELNYAEQQINDTTQESETQINNTFSSLSAAVTNALTNRCNQLINETKTIKQNALLPLQESKVLISNKIKNTTTFITEANNLLSLEVSSSKIEEFNSKSSSLGCLPEVPPLKEVPYVCFQYCSADKESVVDICKQFGSILHIAPVQISTLLERPGAILIEWNVSESEDRFVEKYHLQKASIPSNYNNFHTCYIGSEVQYLVKDINLNSSYTFRVCCKFEGDEEWSPWSLPQIGKTSIRSFSWETNENFVLNNDNKIASPLTIGSVLYSKEIEFNVGYSAEVTFLECDDNLSNNYIGLFTSNEDSKFVLNNAYISFETNGNIYGCGIKKAMEFLPVVKGTKICFTCNYKTKDKLRIHMDCGNSRVTYDWHVNGKNIYIGAQFNSKKWKVLID